MGRTASGDTHTRNAFAGRPGSQRGSARLAPLGGAGSRRAVALFVASLAAAAVVALPIAIASHASRVWNAAPYLLESVPVVMQSQRNDCGPAVVATLAAWSGLALDLASVTAAAQLGPDGLSLGEFARLADRFGFSGAWYRVAAADLVGLQTPFVAHLTLPGTVPLGHLVAVRAVTRGTVTVADPAIGAYVIPLEAFARRFSGRVFLPEAAS